MDSLQKNNENSLAHTSELTSNRPGMLFPGVHRQRFSEMPFPALIPAFFLASWLTMIFWGMVSPDIGVATIGYPKAMLVTIGLWLVAFPLARSSQQPVRSGGRSRFRFMGMVGKEGKKQRDREPGTEWAASSQSVGEDEINISSSFSGISRRITSQSFRGGNIITNFGGVQLDLRSAKLAGGRATLNVRAFIGGIEITVPENWDVEFGVSATLGGISDERKFPGAAANGAPRLMITGSATLGGISVKDS